ncbi:cation diffusion facilitator family transporter [Polyangium sp. 6x1]|uniref:cation diffusion facilitator family transporter n=1 Tax=Polyangium sp. 6x1 TaxID=3042689 RepID=UPI002482FD9F|nr:cation diffusion facilitator family transporter [Polyangium sp. 6x1]MDI1448017.1 cation diffusion facilitator family transporter [Polyangium sp. 6x1]
MARAAHPEEHAHHDHAHHDGHDHDHDHDHDHHDGHDHDKGHAHHDHDHGHAHGLSELRRTPIRRLVVAFAITAGFMFVEAIVGFLSGSLALLADAGHMLADAAALALAMIAQRIASQQRTRARTYGYRRAEVLAAFANGVALALTAVWIFGEAVQRFQEPRAIDGTAMTATAAVGLVVNLVAAAVLSLGDKGHNMNTRAALAHVLSDALGSVGAIVGGVLVLSLGWTRADPIISAVISLLICWGGFKLVRDTSHVLMEGSPIEVDIAHVEETLLKVPGVVGFHDLHVWSISEGFDVLTVHIVIARGFHGTDVVQAVAARMREAHGLEHCTIQPEPSPEPQLVSLRRKSSTENPSTSNEGKN